MTAIELLDFFIADAKENLTALAAAQRVGDRETLNRIVHSLKSSSATIGAMRVADAALHIEAATKTTLDNQATTLCDELTQHLDEFMRVADAERDLLT